MALRFDAGLQSYVHVHCSRGVQFPSIRAFSLELWVKPERAPEVEMGLISKYNHGIKGQYFLSIVPGLRVRFHREVGLRVEISVEMCPHHPYQLGLALGVHLETG